MSEEEEQTVLIEENRDSDDDDQEDQDPAEDKERLPSSASTVYKPATSANHPVKGAPRIAGSYYVQSEQYLNDTEMRGVSSRLEMRHRQANYGAMGGAQIQDYSRQREQEILGEEKVECAKYLEENQGLSPVAAQTLAEVSRRIGRRGEAGTAKAIHEKYQPILENLYQRLRGRTPRTLDDPVPVEGGPFQLILTGNPNKVSTRTLQLVCYSTPDIVGMQGDREAFHLQSSKHPLLLPREKAEFAIAPTHEALVVNLDFLAEQKFRKLVIRGQHRIEHFKFPHGLCMVPMLSTDMCSDANLSDVVQIKLSNLILTGKFITALQRVKMLGSLLLHNCAIADDVKITNLPNLQMLVSGVFSLGDFHVQMDWPNLPRLSTWSPDTSHRLIRKDYTDRPAVSTHFSTASMGEGQGAVEDRFVPPYIDITHNTLNLYEMISPESKSLARLFLRFHFQDYESLVGDADPSALKSLVVNDQTRDQAKSMAERKVGTEIHAMFKFAQVDKVMVDCTMLEKHEAESYIAGPRDVHFHPYNPAMIQMYHQSIVHDSAAHSIGHEFAQANVTMSSLEALKYDSDSVLSAQQATAMWMFLLSLRPKVLSMGPYVPIVLGMASCYRMLPVANGKEDDGRDAGLKQLESQYESVVRGEAKHGKTIKKVQVPAGMDALRILLLMGGDESRIPVIIQQVTPFMNPDGIWMPEAETTAMFQMRLSRSTLSDLQTGKKMPKEVPMYVPSNKAYARKATLEYADLVTERDDRLPYFNPDNEDLDFNHSYLILIRPDASVDLLQGMKEVKASADLEPLKISMREAAKMMDVGKLPDNKNQSGVCGVSSVGRCMIQ